jgi:hypothetical protein
MRLKTRCPTGRAGSTPVLRTTYNNPIAVYTDDTSGFSLSHCGQGQGHVEIEKQSSCKI